MRKAVRLRMLIESAVGGSLLAVIWLILCYLVVVPQRFLPRPTDVFESLGEMDPPIYVHVAATGLQLVIGTVAGTLLGISVGLLVTTFPTARRLLMPSVLMLRAVPPVATVPFFLLWFGFSMLGRFLLISLGVGLNIAAASVQILAQTDEKFVVALTSFGKSMRSYPISVNLPLVMQRILPTLRTSVAIIFGAALVSELLGAQVGLGYLIQTSRTTYAMQVVFLVTIILGVLATLLDWLIIQVWRRFVFWASQGSGPDSRSL